MVPRDRVHGSPRRLRREGRGCIATCGLLVERTCCGYRSILRKLKGVTLRRPREVAMSLEMKGEGYGEL